MGKPFHLATPTSRFFFVAPLLAALVLTIVYAEDHRRAQAELDGNAADAHLTLLQRTAIRSAYAPGTVLRDLATVDAPGTVLRVMSFNLEGRGGNQSTKEGQDRRIKLRKWFQHLCEDPDGPDILFTQEDTSAPLAHHCYKRLNDGCVSESYWWDQYDKFGDGKDMMNAVWMKTVDEFGNRDGMLNLEHIDESNTNLTTVEGMNPRCVAEAVVELHHGGKTKRLTFASFHLSGGYVDDEVASKAVSSMTADDALLSIRQRQLEQFAKGQTGLIISGGDTNGFPGDQAATCQAYRIDNILMPQWIKANPAAANNSELQQEMRDNFIKYETSPDQAGQLQRHILTNRKSAKVCSTADLSTTAWGGQPDQFYTNVKAARAHILHDGLDSASKPPPPFTRDLSDHNPILLEVSVAKIMAM